MTSEDGNLCEWLVETTLQLMTVSFCVDVVVWSSENWWTATRLRRFRCRVWRLGGIRKSNRYLYLHDNISLLSISLHPSAHRLLSARLKGAVGSARTVWGGQRWLPERLQAGRKKYDSTLQRSFTPWRRGGRDWHSSLIFSYFSCNRPNFCHPSGLYLPRVKIVIKVLSSWL